MRKHLTKIIIGIAVTMGVFTGTYTALANGTISFDTSAFYSYGTCPCSNTFTIGASATTNGVIVYQDRNGRAPTSVTDNGSNFISQGSTLTSGVGASAWTFSPTTTVNV